MFCLMLCGHLPEPTRLIEWSGRVRKRTRSGDMAGTTVWPMRTEFRQPIPYRGDSSHALNGLDVFVLLRSKRGHWTEYSAGCLSKRWRVRCPWSRRDQVESPRCSGMRGCLCIRATAVLLRSLLSVSVVTRPSVANLGERKGTRLARLRRPVVAGILGKEIVEALASTPWEGERRMIHEDCL